MQVLIVKMSSMGDVLHTLPALTDAVHTLPGIRFNWVVEENFAQIPTWHPAVRHVLPVAIRRWRKNWLGALQECCEFKHQLQQQRYDAVIDAQGLIKSAALVTRVARGKKHGLDCKSAREPLSSWFYNQRYKVDKQQHAIERVRQLFAASLGYSLPNFPGDYAIASHFKLQSDNCPYPYLVFLHASRHPEKHWPESHWRALIALASDIGYRIKLPWGVRHEYLRAQRLAEGFSQAEVLPPLSLAQIAEQLSSATAVISVDTGLSHLAAALDRPNLTLYGPTDPGLIGTYGRNQQVLRAQNGNMESLTARGVWQAFQLTLQLEK